MKIRLRKLAHVARDHDAPPRSLNVDPSSAQDREELDRFHMQLQTKVDTQAALEHHLSHTVSTREKERASARKLFRQAQVATTMAPSLQPDMLTPPPEPTPDVGPTPVKLASIAPNVDAWFEKNASSLLTDAQQRYPELLKVAAGVQTVPNLKRGKVTAAMTPGATPVQSGLAGGSA